MPELQGRRLADDTDPLTAEPGDYWQMPSFGGQWWIRDPVGNVGRIPDHTITEHDDGTITAEPSIQDEGEHGWHGHLQRGVWTW